MLSAPQKQELKLLLERHGDAFKTCPIPTPHAVHRIDTGDHGPICMPPYRLSPPKLEALKKEVQTMLDEGIIAPCASPWAAPVVMVPKKDGSIRVYVDYRRLNAVTVPDIYPLPRIDDLLHDAKPTPFMSTLDQKAGFWQICVREEDQEKTAFITPFGIYQFNSDSEMRPPHFNG